MVGWDGGKVEELDFYIFIGIFFFQVEERIGNLGRKWGGNGKKIEGERMGKTYFFSYN